MVKKASPGFSPEEKRLRVRMVEKGLRMKDIAAMMGVVSQDVSMVFRGTSRSPRYVAEVYKILELEQPAEQLEAAGV